MGAKRGDKARILDLEKRVTACETQRADQQTRIDGLTREKDELKRNVGDLQMQMVELARNRR